MNAAVDTEASNEAVGKLIALALNESGSRPVDDAEPDG